MLPFCCAPAHTHRSAMAIVAVLLIVYLVIILSILLGIEVSIS